MKPKWIYAVLLVAVMAAGINNQASAQDCGDLVLNYEKTDPSKIAIKELPPGVNNLPLTSHWWVGLSALPVDVAEAVVTAVVTKREVLPKGEADAFTRYEVKVNEAFKDASGQLRTGSPAVLVRYGGSVRFKSGKIQKYWTDGLGTLDCDGRYLLFLKKYNGVDWSIMTGYDISSDRAIPVDQKGPDPRSQLIFERYRDVSVSTLFEDLRTAVAKESAVK